MTLALGSSRLQSIPLPGVEPEPDRGSPPWMNMKVLAGAGAAGFLFLLLGVIVIIRNKDGKEVVRLEVPDGNSVEVQQTPGNVTSAKPITTFKEPAFQQWMKDVQAMPAEEQIKAVSKKLMELNPGFDGKLTPGFEGRSVTELRFVTDNVTDISPVRALAELKGLSCQGSNLGQGDLADLSPLQGMKLTMLSLSLTQVSNLSPLQGMPLISLSVSGTKVSDLSPLKGMPLSNLTFGFTLVSDLSPLIRMPLRILSCHNNLQLSDLSALQGIPTLSALLIKPHQSKSDQIR